MGAPIDLQKRSGVVGLGLEPVDYSLILKIVSQLYIGPQT